MEVILVVCGLLVGLGVGFVAGSRRRGSPPTPEAVAPALSDGLERPSTARVVAPSPAKATAVTPPAPEAAATEAAPAGQSPLELCEQELERARTLVAEQRGRIDELESQARRLRRWAGGQLQRTAAQLETVWKREKLPTRVHDMGKPVAEGLLEELRQIAEPLEEGSRQLGVGDATIHCWLGLWHALEGRAAPAVECFELALRKGIDGEAARETRLALGDALWLLDRRRKARDAYRQVLDRKRVPALVLHRCAQVALEERAYADALSHLEPLLERKQPPLEAFLMASRASLQLGDHARSLAFSEAGLKKHPDEPLLLASAIVPLGRLGQKERMEEAARRSRELDPRLAEPAYSLGVIRLDEGDLDGAEALFSEALEVRPEYPEALFSLGVIHNKRGEFRKALELLQRAVDLRPDYAEAYYNMKESYDGLRDFESSIAVLKKAVRLNPEYR